MKLTKEGKWWDGEVLMILPSVGYRRWLARMKDGSEVPRREIWFGFLKFRARLIID